MDDAHGFHYFNLQIGTMSHGCLRVYSNICMCLGNCAEGLHFMLLAITHAQYIQF